MQPWKISAGLTAAIAGSAVLLAGPRLEYLAPYWPLLLAVARAAGLADLGRRVDLAERSVRRGEGDPALTDALRRDAEGDWE